MIGGILLGIIEIFFKAYISTQLSDAIVFAVLIVVLIVKPDGLLGKHVSEKYEVAKHEQTQTYSVSQKRLHNFLYDRHSAFILIQTMIATGNITSSLKGQLVPICALYRHGDLLKSLPSAF